MILYFDTETTGLSPGGIIQLSYIMQNGNELLGKNFYFYNSYISPSSTSVHGITVEKLAELSQGKTFYDYVDEIEEDFNGADLVVAHNFPFDFNFISAEFANCYRTFKYKEKFDTMRFFTPLTKIPRENGKGYKYPKLCELADYFDIFSYDVTRLSLKLFKGSGISHDARFDVTQTYLCVERAQEQFCQVKELLDQYK